MCGEDHRSGPPTAADGPVIRVTFRRMEQRHTFEWDVLAHPVMDDWLDALRVVGWYRDPAIPGIKTPNGTIEYSFYFLGQEDTFGA